MKKVKAYKVFDNDWTCQGFQYEVGKSYHVDNIKICERGFHACKKLINCFQYYPLVQWQKFAEVELSGDILGLNSNKQCSTDIKIKKELSFNEVLDIIKKEMNKPNGVNRSDGVNWSDGVNKSNGVNRSNGVNGSYGVNKSYGIDNCFGVSNVLFTNNKKADYLLFGKKISQKRWEKINNEFRQLLNGWTPTYNNLKSLYIKSRNEWKSTPIPNAKEIQKKEAWKDMPKEAIKYLKKLKEFDKKIFKDITGLNTQNKQYS